MRQLARDLWDSGRAVADPPWPGVAVAGASESRTPLCHASVTPKCVRQRLSGGCAAGWPWRGSPGHQNSDGGASVGPDSCQHVSGGCVRCQQVSGGCVSCQRVSGGCVSACQLSAGVRRVCQPVRCHCVAPNRLTPRADQVEGSCGVTEDGEIYIRMPRSSEAGQNNSSASYECVNQ